MIRKAVVLAAGMGSRLCPLTPFLPKEMLPIGGLPALHHVLRELADGGIREVLVVLSEGKQSIVDYLTKEISPKGERAIALSEERDDLLSKLRFDFAWQKKPRGTADAIYLARDFMGSDPLLVAYPDDLLSFAGDQGGVEVIPKLGELTENSGKSALLVREIPRAEASSYGVVTLGERCEEDVYVAMDIVEKPRVYGLDRAFAMIGRFTITPEVTESIPYLPVNDAEGIVPALVKQAKRGALLALVHRGMRLDIGSHGGYAHACQTLAIEDCGEKSGRTIYGERTLSNLPS